MADETVETREIDIDALVDMVEGKDRYKPSIAYTFSNGREFVDLEEASAIYNPV